MNALSYERSYSPNAAEIVQVPIADIKRPSFSLRLELTGLEGLKASIRAKGLLEPLIVRPSDDYFEVIAGNRRFQACKELGFNKVPCIVKIVSDRVAYEIALTENIQRESLSAIEEAEAFKTYVINFGWGGVTALAKRIGKSEEYVSHRMLLLNLPKKVLEKIGSDGLTVSHAKELVWLRDEHQQTQLASLIVHRKLSTRETHDIIRKLGQGSDPSNIGIWIEHQRNAYEDHESRDIKVKKILEQGILGLRSALYCIDKLLRDSEGFLDLQIFLKQERCTVHKVLDDFVKEKVKLARNGTVHRVGTSTK